MECCFYFKIKHYFDSFTNTKEVFFKKVCKQIIGLEKCSELYLKITYLGTKYKLENADNSFINMIPKEK